MPIKKKFSKLIVKDASGNLVQLLPETQVDTSLDSTSDFPIANSAVASALNVYQGATTSANGIPGTVPAATSANKDKYLKGDGTWSNTYAQGPFGTTVAMSNNAIDLSTGNVFTKTISANTTFTITGVPSGTVAVFTIILTNGGNYTVTWPNSVKWKDSTAPDLTASGKDVLTFLTPDGGTTWYGTVSLSGVA